MNTEVHFKEIENIIIKELDKAQDSVFIAVAWITSTKILNSISNCLNRFVKIKLISVNDKINNLDTFLKLSKEGADIKLLSNKLMHNKFCIIDNEIIISGSYNWTTKATSNLENITISRNDFELINKFNDEFEKIWNKCIDLSQLLPFDVNYINEIETEFDEYLEKIKNQNTLPYLYYINEHIKPKDLFYSYTGNSSLFGGYYTWKWENAAKGYYLITNDNVEYDFFQYLFYSKKNDSFSNYLPFSKEWKIKASRFQNILLEQKNTNEDFFKIKDEIWVETTDGFITKVNKQGEINSEIKYKIDAKFESEYLINKNDSKEFINQTGKFKQIIFFGDTPPPNNIVFNSKFINKSYVKSEVYIENGYKKTAIYDLSIYINSGGMVSFPFFDSISFETENDSTIHFESPVLLMNGNSIFSTFINNRYNNNNTNNSHIQKWKFQNDKLTKIENQNKKSPNDLIPLYLNDSDFGVLYLAIAVLYDNWGLEYLNKAKLKFQLRNKSYNFFEELNIAKKIVSEINIIKERDFNASIKFNNKNDNKTTSDNCFIATAIYGDLNHPKTIDFRKYRDKYLINHFLGIKFVKFYYQIAPYYVSLLKKSSLLTKITRKILFLIHSFIKKKL